MANGEAEGETSGLAPRPGGALDNVGQRNETIRVRLANLSDRLEEIQSLKEEFASLVDPVFDVIDTYPQLRSRLLETEAVLRRETASTTALRREAADLADANARMADDLTTVSVQLRQAESKLREQTTSIEEMRLAIKDKNAAGADLERRLGVETGRVQALTEETGTLRQAMQEADQRMARLEQETIEFRERNSLLDHEVKRLEKVTEEQNYRLSGLTSLRSDLESQLDTVRQNASEMETKLLNEQVALQRAEAQLESERSEHQAALSGSEMKIEGLNSRMTVINQLLAHTRDQLRDRSEEVRTAERNLKEATVERKQGERRMEATQEEVQRQSAIVAELQRTRTDAMERIEMLNKAITAKDFQIANSDAKLASMTERMDQMARRFDQERNALEAANRRLLEELQSEKSERSFAQGALEISRETRTNIQKKYVALRRASRLEPAEGDASAGEDEAVNSNVLPIKPADQS